ncbi:cyclin-dependent kinase 7 isoform X1 [Pseudopipra pipra]|uniref:cyclin-dependent kinase 7 isoform X1 n=1 Tax=Pseudopipra pipra TaxID=415032 RepID=UPI00313956FE
MRGRAPSATRSSTSWGRVSSPPSIRPGTRPITESWLLRRLNWGIDRKLKMLVWCSRILFVCRLLSFRDPASGINRTALREIKLLQELSHPNIIGLIDAFGHKSNISLVFDFMETDLEVIIKDTSIVLTQSHIKAYMLMTLQGLEYLHQHWILHRDLKPNNLLLDENGVLKLADFGLAKSFGSPNRVYTHQVVTRWYRAPELLFGARMYGVGVDMWAVGCILAELLLRVPFLPGDSDLDQLTRIFETLGTPTEEQWPGMTSLPDYVTFKSFPGMPLQHIFSAAGDDLLNLLQGLFTFNPCTRVTATQALKQKYFSNRPGPTPGNQLPRPNCPAEAVKEQQNALLNLKRKKPEGIDQGKQVNCLDHSG